MDPQPRQSTALEWFARFKRLVDQRFGYTRDVLQNREPRLLRLPNQLGS